jgi:hypothetical protein
MTYAATEKQLRRSRTPPDGDVGYTYLISDGWRHVKIGRSADPQKRLSGLQTSTPSKLTIVHSWLTTANGSLLLEAELHRAFDWVRQSGEWFDIYAADIKSVGDALFAGHHTRAHELLRLIRRDHEIRTRLVDLKRAWYRAKPKDRRQAERDAKAEAANLERERLETRIRALQLGAEFQPDEHGMKLRSRMIERYIWLLSPTV